MSLSIGWARNRSNLRSDYFPSPTLYRCIYVRSRLHLCRSSTRASKYKDSNEYS